MKVDMIGAKQRKSENILVISGIGIMMFGAWSMVKGLAMIFLNSATLDSVEDQVDPAYTTLAKGIAIVMLVIILGADLLFRVYIGRSAAAEGKGRKKGWFYVICTGIILAVSLVSVIMYLVPGLAGDITLVEKIPSVFVELSSAGVSAGLIRAAIQVKRAEKEVDYAA